METRTDFLNDVLSDRTVIFYPGEGEVLHLNSGRITLKVTSSISNDQLGVYEVLLQPGTVGARLHYHRYMDETFIVQKGVLTVQLRNEEADIPAGSVIYIPRMTPHGFSNRSNEEVVLSLLFNPGQQREGFFRGLRDVLSEQPVDPEKYLKLYHKYDSYPVDATQMLPVV